MRKTHKPDASTEVQLNLTAMLDMAFQLLAFFVLTFNPGKPDIHWEFAIPPAQSVANKPQPNANPGERITIDPHLGVDSLVVSVQASPTGEIASMAVGEVPIATLAGLDARLHEILDDRHHPFKQVILQMGSNLRCDAVAQLIDVCVNQRLPQSGEFRRLSFVELPDH